MRTKHLLMFLAAAIAGGFALNYTLTANYERSYAPKSVVSELYSTNGYLEWLHQIKVNQHTQTIEAEHIAKANDGLKQLMSKSGNHEAFNWKEKGPNNIGGRTRALLIDKNNPSTIWAGAVSGGIWKSVSGGQYWEKVNYSVSSGFTPTSVTTIAQAADGKIYFGTGEAFTKFFGTDGSDNQHYVGINQATPLIKGGGIFKQDGSSFVRLAATAPDNSSDFYGVRRLVAHPTNANELYAATTTGVWKTTDGGTTWTKAIADPGQSWDVAIGTDGTVVANVATKTYRKLPTESTFTIISGLLADNNLTEIQGRYVYDFYFGNPNFVFASIADANGELQGIYRSQDKGTTWHQIGFGYSTEFQPFGANKQGIYNHALKSVSPYHVVLGGIDLWLGSGVEGAEVFEWNKISYWSYPENHPLYLHADIHTIELIPDGSGMFVGTDGGIFIRSTSGNRAMNTYYNVTQFYRADINNAGQIIGGTQDNGTILLKFDLPGSQEQYGRKILDGDGMDCLFSKLSNNVLLMASQYGRMQRSNDLGEERNYFWSSYMTTAHGWNSETFEWPSKNAAWVAPMALWESDDYRYIRADTAKIMSLRAYEDSTWYRIESANIPGQYLWWYTGDRSYQMGDTLKYPDPYQATLLFGMGDRIWFTRKGLQRAALGRYDWWDIFDKKKVEGLGTMITPARFVSVIFSHDGDIAYGATEPDHQGNACIYRISNLHACTKPSDASFGAFSSIGATPRITQVQTLGKIAGRYITDMAIDPKNPEVLIVTMGQYGNDAHVFVAQNAATTTSDVWADNFVSIQGDLPLTPVYTVCVNNNPAITGQLLIGTDFGVFITDNYLATNVTWQEGNGGLGHYPVFDIRQTYVQRRQTGRYRMGTFVVATHGRGVFVDTAHRFEIVGLDDQISVGNPAINDVTLSVSVYPNPATEIAYAKISVNERAVVDIFVYDLTGKLVYTDKTSKLEAGVHTIEIPVSDLNMGTYLVQCITGNTKKTVKLLKK